jgi:hypothetical protein
MICKQTRSGHHVLSQSGGGSDRILSDSFMFGQIRFVADLTRSMPAIQRSDTTPTDAISFSFRRNGLAFRVEKNDSVSAL